MGQPTGPIAPCPMITTEYVEIETGKGVDALDRRPPLAAWKRDPVGEYSIWQKIESIISTRC